MKKVRRQAAEGAFLCFLKGEYLMLASDMVGTGPTNQKPLEVSGGRCTVRWQPTSRHSRSTGIRSKLSGQSGLIT